MRSIKPRPFMSTSTSADAAQIAFDTAAETYDADFTESVLGRLQRDQLWRLYDRVFEPGGRLLDLGCGTGEDLLRFAGLGYKVEGVDLSAEMIRVAEQRIADAGLEDRAVALALPLERLNEFPERGFCGAYSSFCGLNCVADLRPVAKALADRLEPGAPLALCLMSRTCLWETLLYPLTRQLHKTARRRDGWVRAGVGNGELWILYHGMGEVKAAFAPWFTLAEAPGVGVFTPPTYLEPWARRWPGLMRALAWMDDIVAGWPLFRLFAEHRVAVLRRTRDEPQSGQNRRRKPAGG
jgi:SAM-dependent methyltransferase